MAGERRIPEDPARFIQTCVKARRIRWTYHVNMRLAERHISRQAILESGETFEIIESYPTDEYLPRYLVYAKDRGDVFHVVFAVDVEGDNVRVVTTYRPDPQRWEEDLKTRRYEA